VVALVREGERVNVAAEGDELELVLDRTPFYGEQGGQVGDTGRIETAAGFVLEVTDTQIRQGVIVHVGHVKSGSLTEGDSVLATIDVQRRERIRRNHTATHLLHWALRLVLGEHVHQGGSLVTPERLRFDYTHFEAPSAEQLAKVEKLVNSKIFENHQAMAYETTLSSAKEAGVTALFGEKYGEFVRVLEVGNFSKELCGGTHVSRTSEINLFKLVGEGSVGANLRRVEAVTSFGAFEYVRREESELTKAAEAFKVARFDVGDRATGAVARIKELESAVKTARSAVAGDDLARLLDGVIDVGYKLLVAQVDAPDVDAVREISDLLRTRMGGGAVVLGVPTAEGGVVLLAAGDDAAVSAGFNAGAVVKEVAPLVDGRGGGKPGMAQAGGKNAAGLAEALLAAKRFFGAE
jgi:alanyl-tRNA synthetase